MSRSRKRDADNTWVVVLLTELIARFCQVPQHSRQDPGNPSLAVAPHACDHLRSQHSVMGNHLPVTSWPSLGTHLAAPAPCEDIIGEIWGTIKAIPPPDFAPR